jgi:glycopeptide antibiotics resistance protein
VAIPRRAILGALCFSFVAFAVYGSFVPFRLEPLSLHEALARFQQIPGPDPWRASRTDFVANVLLFVPIGCTLAGLIADRSRRLAVAAVPLTAAVAIALSVAIEFGQVFISGRTPSWNDVVAESGGALAGALAWLAAGRFVADWLRPLTEPSTPLLRARRLLGLYTAAWLVLHLLPFDFTLRVAELAEKYRAGRIVVTPFADTGSTWDTLVAVGSGALQAMPIGALAVVAFTRASRLATVLIGMFVIAATEFAQLLALSRTADSTDLIAGTLGVVAGGHVAYGWLRRTQSGVGARPESIRPWALAALAAWLAVLIARHWAPFDFVLSRAMFDERIGRMVQLPFQSYYWGNYLASLGEAFTKILLGIPVGALLQIFWPPAPRRSTRWLQRLVFVVAAAAVFVGIELGQVMLPGRFPDSTDVLLGVLGACAGIASVMLVASAGGRRRTDGATDRRDGALRGVESR